MKKILLCLLSSMLFVSAYAERELTPIKWTEIEKTVAAYPDSVKSLVKRLSLPTLDRSLTWDERRLAFYGQSILVKDKDEKKVDEAEQAYRAGDYKKALQQAEIALSINQLSLSALITAEHSILKLIEAGDSTYQKSDAEIYYNRTFRIYNTIATTGDGSKEYPFYVTKVSDEYNFMRHYMELWEYDGQKLVGTCDVFNLKEPSKYYADKEIWFDTSRSLKLLNEKFK